MGKFDSNAFFLSHSVSVRVFFVSSSESEPLFCDCKNRIQEQIVKKKIIN